MEKVLDIAQFGAHHITKVGSRPDLCSFLLQKASEKANIAIHLTRLLHGYKLNHLRALLGGQDVIKKPDYNH